MAAKSALSFRCCITQCLNKNKDINIISYAWIPGHCNIDGNEQADTAGKLAHSSPNSLTLPLFTYNDVKRVIEKDTVLQCQKEWNEMSTKLNEVKKSVQPYLFPANTTRKHETSINRLRIGHTLSFNEERRPPNMLLSWSTPHCLNSSH
ncbi:RNase H domain-containing protein [Aphis craccivora]|uniref:RNase H domain-containing protein n=1 Tax=Aphis craccivora TaxID=307492 RepID=A0A6G0ZCE7_APHCR|nr:RNase H domain-containing protein [Aphis craccivora]